MTDLALFADVQAVLDLAISRGGVAYHAKTARGDYSRGAAVKFIQRAYMFRKALRAHTPQVLGEIVRTPYDELAFSRACGCTINTRCDCPTGHIVHISPVGANMEVTDLAGEPLEVAPTNVRPLTPENELISAAARVRRQLLDD